MTQGPGSPAAGPSIREEFPTWGTTRARLRYARAVGNPGFALQAILAPLLVAAVLALLTGLVIGEIELLTLPMLAFLIACVPIMRDPDYDLFSPWTFVLMSVVFGMALRGPYILLGWPSEEAVDARFLGGQPHDFFLWSSLVLVIGVVSMTAGYSVRSSFQIRRWPRLLQAGRWDKQRVYIVVGLCFIISVAAALIYLDSIGGFDPERISAKRNLAGVELDSDFESYTYLVIIAGFGQIGALVLVAYFAFNRIRLTPTRVGVLAILFLNTLFLPFYTSSRDGLVWPGIFAMAIWVIAGRRVRLRTVVILALVGMMGVQTVTVLRHVRESTTSAAVDSIDLPTVIDPLVFNRNMIGLAKTAHIIDAIPDRLDYAYGSSLLSTLAAPIPRAFWPGKPIIGSGKTIGSVVFGADRAGVPPGFIGEMYWNFHLLGVVGGGLLLGYATRRLYETFRPHLTNPTMVLLYVTGIMPVAYRIVGSEVAKGLIDPMINLAQLFIVLSLVVPRRTRARSGV